MRIFSVLTQIKNHSLVSALLLLGGLVLIQELAVANSCPTSPTTISSTTNDECALSSGGSVTINSSGKIINTANTGTGNAVAVSSGVTNTNITNAGLLQSDVNNTIYNLYGEIIQISNTRGAPGAGIISTALYSSAVLNFGGSIGLINNSGLIQSTGDGTTVTYNNSGIYNVSGFIAGTISTITNTGTIEGLSGNGITNESGTIATLTNTYVGAGTGIIRGGGANTSGVSDRGILNAGTITNLTNGVNATIDVTSYGDFGILNMGTIGTLNNSGSIAAAVSNGGAIWNTGGTISSLNNTATGSISATSVGILQDAGSTIATLTNAGTISGSAYGINNSGTISTLTNSGTISGGSASGIVSRGEITTLTNTGSITGTYGIENIGSGRIPTLNNLQSNLTYTGVLPTNYNIIINSPTAFGKLAVTSGTGTTAFGINSGSTVSNNHAYVGVLSGVTAGQVTNTSGTYGGYNWALSLESGSSTIWDLIFGSLIPPGPSTVDTQTSLANTASVLQNTFTLQNSVLANSFTYDCELFDVNNICVSAGGRNTAVSAANGLNNTSALLIAAYRPHPNYRIGAYADQNLSVNNAGSTVNLGNNTPLIGLFGVWNQKLDGTGTEVKVSAAYGQKNAAVTRSVVGTSEAGSGSSQLNSQGVQVVTKYGFGVADNVIVSPYAGIRYTQNNMGGYTEATSTSVTAPLTYSALNTNATTALAGVGASYKFIPQAMVFASAGVETDTNTANGTYSATGVTGLTPVNFNANPVKTRPTATVGAYYDIVRNQRLGVTGIYRQEPYQAVSTTTVMATYTIGL